MTYDEDNDILERLKHPEREAQRRRPSRLLYVRNVLNSLFILLAVVAMVGIGLSWRGGSHASWGYAVGIVAVLVKMVEALLRMPTLLRTPQKRSRRHTNDTEDSQSK